MACHISQNPIFCNSISGAIHLIVHYVFPCCSSLLEVPLSPTVTSLNLHCNRISRIEALTSGGHLRHLDLSSNRISHIEGLASLTSLRTLNLSCNLIAKVEGESTSLLKDNGSQRVGFSPSRYSSLRERRLTCQWFMIRGVTEPLVSFLLCPRPQRPCEPRHTKLILQQDKQPYR